MEVSGPLQAPLDLPQGKNPRYPLNRRMGGPQSWTGRGDEKKKIHHCTFRELNAGRPARSVDLETRIYILHYGNVLS